MIEVHEQGRLSALLFSWSFEEKLRLQNLHLHHISSSMIGRRRHKEQPVVEEALPIVRVAADLSCWRACDESLSLLLPLTHTQYTSHAGPPAFYILYFFTFYFFLTLYSIHFITSPFSSLLILILVLFTSLPTQVLILEAHSTDLSVLTEADEDTCYRYKPGATGFLLESLRHGHIYTCLYLDMYYAY